MVHYCLRRCTNDGVRTHVKYFTGDAHHMVTANVLLDWVDYPDDINITVMDAVMASKVMEYVKNLTRSNTDITYNIASLANIHAVSQHLDDLTKL